jgi:hypothetical protein
MYTTQSEELFRIGLKHLIVGQVENQPDPSYTKIISEMMETKEAVTTRSVRQGFGLHQFRPVGVAAPTQTEQLKVKQMRPRRYALGYDNPSNLIERDPNRLAAQQGPLLRKSAHDTMNFLAQTAFLQMVAGAPNAITSAFDGQAIFANNHVMGAGTQSNLLTVAMDAAGLITMMETLAAQGTTEGNPTEIFDQYDLLCPSSAYMRAEVLVKSELRAGTQNNDKNLLKGVINVCPMEWWSFAGAGVASDFALQPSNAKERPMFGIMTQQINVETEKSARHGMTSTFSTFEVVFEAMSHLGAIYSNAA